MCGSSYGAADQLAVGQNGAVETVETDSHSLLVEAHVLVCVSRLCDPRCGSSDRVSVRGGAHHCLWWLPWCREVRPSGEDADSSSLFALKATDTKIFLPWVELKKVVFGTCCMEFSCTNLKYMFQGPQRNIIYCKTVAYNGTFKTIECLFWSACVRAHLPITEDAGGILLSLVFSQKYSKGCVPSLDTHFNTTSLPSSVGPLA